MELRGVIFFIVFRIGNWFLMISISWWGCIRLVMIFLKEIIWFGIFVM